MDNSEAMLTIAKSTHNHCIHFHNRQLHAVHAGKYLNKVMLPKEEVTHNHHQRDDGAHELVK